MNSAFGVGGFLNGTYDPSQHVWKLYAKISDVVYPQNTFLFDDEHPGSINAGEFSTACTGAQPSDPPSAAKIIDVPASWHDDGAAFSFADGRAEIHKWVGSAIKPPLTDPSPRLNYPADDSYLDAQWLATNTTVKR